MIRVCKDSKKKYKSLGVSVNPKYWNFERNTLKPNCPNYEYLSKLIADKASELSAEIVKLKTERKEFTASTLIDNRAKRVKPKTVHDLFCEQIQRLTDEGRRGYMLSVKQVYNSLLSFNNHLDICFSNIDVCFLRRYETWLRKQGLAENTITAFRVNVHATNESDLSKGTSQPLSQPLSQSIEEKIVEFCKEPRSLAEIMRYLGYKDRVKFKKKYINPLLGNALAMTIPDKPNSRNQKYVAII